MVTSSSSTPSTASTTTPPITTDSTGPFSLSLAATGIDKLRDDNYSVWETQMTAALQERPGFFEFANGDTTAEDKQRTTWRQKDQQVRGFIVRHLDSSQFHLIDGWQQKTSEAVWKAIKDGHEKTGPFAMVHHWQQLTQSKFQDGDSMQGHLDSFREHNRRLVALGLTLPESALACALLSTLPHSWDPFIMSLPKSTGHASIGFTFTELHNMIKAEARRQATQQSVDGTAMIARGNTAPTTARSPCIHCRRTNHASNKCWTKFPELRPGYNKDKQSQGQANMATATAPASTPTSPAATSKPSAATLAPQNDGLLWFAEAVGPTALATSSGLSVSYRSDDRLEGAFVDSGASYHYTPHREWLVDFIPSSGGYVTLADKRRLPIVGQGTLRAYVTVPDRGTITTTFSPVYCVPTLSVSLLSVSGLTETKLSALFVEDKCIIRQDNNRGPIAAIAHKVKDNGKLWRLSLQPCALADAPSLTAPAALLTTVPNATSTYQLWHNRLGHVNKRSLLLLFDQDMVADVNASAIARDIRSSLSSHSSHCEACALGKHHRAPIPRMHSNSTTAPLQLVHADLCGPFPVISRNGANYFIVIVDDYSRFVWLAAMASKSQALDRFKEYQAWAEAAHSARGLRISRLRTDGGGEFCSRAFDTYCTGRGISHELTAAYTPQQNGVAERANQTIVEGARTLLQQSGLPNSFWPDAASTVAYVRNRCPTSSHSKATPFERWTGVKPSVSHLRPFGCLAHAQIPDRYRDKLTNKARRCVLVGYSPASKQYRLYDPERRTTFESRDVTCVEQQPGYGNIGEGALSASDSQSPTPAALDIIASPDISPSAPAPAHESNPESDEDVPADQDFSAPLQLGALCCPCTCRAGPSSAALPSYRQ